ncbi:2-hydroxyacid dehydrogenase [Marinivivus vitaminiproducens]|uniref:2-hydroxyacid dehydrogenase n=1 Tax=Marinivivus vitaminiproducens TaxID=3035935 RepID=UPI0027A442FC|nr:2-hydroxyacid dehydrogenase [Geminicoccaceae bacterium SCSIO 64248]
MTADVLMLGPMHPRVGERLDAEFRLHRLWQADDPAKLLAEHGGRIGAIAAGGHKGPDEAVYAACPNLKVISAFGVGYDGIDVGLASKHGVTVTNTPDVLNDCVADIALALMLSVSRRIVEADRFTRAGKWPNGAFPFARQLTGSKLGIVGLGRIGKAIAKRAQGFDMTIAYHGRNRQDSPFAYYGDLKEMAAWADILCLIVPGGAGTRHMVDREILEAVGPEGILINVARGSVVDEAALVETLRSGKLGAAGLDVFDREPHVPEALFALDNVVLLPHIASATHQTRNAMADLVVDNIKAVLDGKPPLTPVPG